MGDLAIRVQPRAKRTEIAGERGGTVVIRVARQARADRRIERR
jgi:uncharacterized protein YggU (UPF0235/DUF167 family)